MTTKIKLSDKKTVTLSGIIKIEYRDSWKAIRLVQEDGYKYDLISRFQEAYENYGQGGVQVNYYLSDNVCTKNEMLEGWLKKISGGVDLIKK